VWPTSCVTSVAIFIFLQNLMRLSIKSYSPLIKSRPVNSTIVQSVKFILSFTILIEGLLANGDKSDNSFRKFDPYGCDMTSYQLLFDPCEIDFFRVTSIDFVPRWHSC
ncbi:unnamed protein product, partial [Acidithrix sp. C25]